MKTNLMVVLLILLMVTYAYANDKPVYVHNGIGTGQDYLKMTESEKRAYAMGAINGMLVSPLLGAPKDKMLWLESYVENMTDEQIAAILTKYLQDNPGRWHDGLNVIMYSAMKEAYNKSRTAGKNSP